jgi:uncharacterized membrane protein YhaH (DUF805 family)
MKQYFSFDGKTSRKEYSLVFVVLQIIGIITLMTVYWCYAHQMYALATFILVGEFIVSKWASISLAAKRCNGAGISRKWSWITFIPYFSLVSAAIFFCIGEKKNESRD